MRTVMRRALVVAGLLGATSLALALGPTPASAAPAQPDACARSATLERAIRYDINVKPIARDLADYHCRYNPGAARKAPLEEFAEVYDFRLNDPCARSEVQDLPKGKTNGRVAQLQAECVAEQVELVEFFRRQPPACVRSINLANAGRDDDASFASARDACGEALEAAGLPSIGLASTSTFRRSLDMVSIVIFMGILYLIGRGITHALIRKFLGPSSR